MTLTRVSAAIVLCFALQGCIALGGIGLAGSIVAGAAAGTTAVSTAPAAGHVIHNIITRNRGCRLVELWKCPVPGDKDF